MSFKRQRGEVWEYTFKKAGVLEKPLYLTFTTEKEGDEYSVKLEMLLDRGIVPTEYQTVSRITSIESLVRVYLRDAHVKHRDAALLSTICKTVGTVPLALITANWVDNWISDMKRINKVAPATIRGKIGALARCIDWGSRKSLLLMPVNPLRTLPEGYAQYTKVDEALSGVKREDVERDRRLEAGEYERICRAIEAGVLPRKQRPYTLPDKVALLTLLTLALESAMRLREMFTLTLDQLNLAKRTIFLDKTKNGDRRQVPLSSTAMASIKSYLIVREIPGTHPKGNLFPWWDGSTNRKDLDGASDFLSKLWINIFHQAQCPDLKFHDLRHEATSRLFERTSLSDVEIMKITGHKSVKMLMRYANLRGSNLADKLG